MKKLLVLQKMNGAVKERFVEALSAFFNIEFAESFEAGYLKKAMDGVDVCFGSSLPDDIIRGTHQLKVFQLAGTGVDRLNLSLFEASGIEIYKTQTQSKYVAEFAVALMFDLLKKLSFFDRQLRTYSIQELRNQPGVNYNSSTLLGKTVGLIGFGHIGKAIRSFLSPYGNTVLVNSLSGAANNHQEDVSFVTLNRLVAESDIVFITCPLTAATRGLIGGEAFDLAKPGSFWVNISRGAVVEYTALVNALNNNKIAGFGLDNWYADIRDAEVSLKKFDQVVLSPYRAINIDDDNPNINDAIDNLLCLGKGMPMSYRVDFKKGY